MFKMLEHILKFEEPDAQKIELVGGKGSSLAYLSSIDRINVPEGFCVSTSAYDLFIHNNKLNEKIKEFSEIIEELSKEERDKKTEALRKDFIKSFVPRGVEENVKEAYRDIYRKFSYRVGVAVRSSATTEDLENESFAGLHDTYLNITGENNVVEAVKRCWASFYTDRAVEYRKVNDFGQYGEHLKMAVVIQRMVNPIAAGVALSVDNSTAYNGVVIESNYGLGESIVSGEVNPDRFVVHKQTLDIIKAQKGSKNKKFVYSKNGGTEIVEVFAEDREKFCLDFGNVKEIANSVNKIQEAYSKRTRFVDTEFAIDKKGLFFLQARPATLDLRVITIEQEALKNSIKIYGGGTRATRIAGHGIIKIVPSFHDLKNGKIKVSFEDIVVTNHTWNEWTEYLRGIKGIVAEQGGILSHAAIISKEWGIPGIVGCDGVVDILRKYEREKATIDANRRSLYLHYLPLAKRRINLDEESMEVKFENE